MADAMEAMEGANAWDFQEKGIAIAEKVRHSVLI